MSLDRISRLIEDRAGLVLSESTKQRLGSFVARRCAALGFSAVEPYLRLLSTEQQEFQEIVNTVTVSKTAFFRYPKHIDAICQHLVPALDAALTAGRAIHIWCAAVSSGEEPYSLAMALDHFGWFARRPITLFGTDINDVSLDRARKGEYHLDEANRERIPDYARKYFEAAGADHRFRISERLRARVELAHANLNALASGFATPFHVVLCCNVLIYFDETNRRRVITDIQARMAEQSALLLGGAEIAVATGPAYRVHEIGGCFAHLRGAWHGLALPARAEPSSPPPGVIEAPLAAANSAHALALKAPSGPARSDTPAPVRAVKSASEGSVSSADLRDSPNRWRVETRAFLDANQFEEARRVLEVILERDPFCEEAHFLDGRALRALGRPDEAESAFRRAVFLDPDFALARYELGLLRHLQGDFAAASREYQRVLASVSSRSVREPKTSVELQDARGIEKFMEHVCIQNRELALAGVLPGAAPQ